MNGINGPINDPDKLLERRICDLGLSLAGSRVERFLDRLRRELLRKKITRWQPSFYLTDEWGCPSGQPIIGVPFYLADPRLAAINRQFDDLEDDREIMMFLRHEAGHAYNYAYRLYTTPEWRDHFGPWRRPYRDHYRPKPFSKSFVRHIAGWYAQKHPDEDFAETFAVWLTPGSGWRKRYRDWPAIRKLKFLDQIVKQHREVDPHRKRGLTDITVDEMDMTVGEFYRQQDEQKATAVEVEMHTDLPNIFLPHRRRKRLRAAAEVVVENRELLIDKIEHWTGVRRPVVRALVETMARYCRELNLYAELGKEPEYLVELATYGTTLAMNFLTRGRFEPV
jgi:hypothetical protein